MRILIRYGKVYIAQDRSTKEVYAAKIMSKLAIAEEDQDMALVERRVLTMQPPSPFVARLCAAFQTEGHVFLVMEFLHGGDLEGHLKQDGERKMFSPEVVRHVTAQVLLGLWYLHSKGCM
jgi:serine/threonine protein kinase